MASVAPARRRTGVWLAAIVVLAALLRLPGQLYPLTLHYDEGAEVSSVLCRFPPAGAMYHPFLSRYLLSIPENLNCVTAKLRGVPHAGAETRAEFEVDPSRFIHAGRALSFVFGVAAVIAVYFLGAAYGGTTVGLLAALFVAVAPIHIMVSNNLRPWALASLMCALVFLALHKVLRPEATRKQILLAGTLIGLAVSTIYTLALFLAPLAIALIARWKQQRSLALTPAWLGDLTACAVGGIGAHVVSNFTGLLNITRTLGQAVQPTASMLSSSAGGGDVQVKLNYAKNVSWYFGALIDSMGLTWPIAIVGLAGLAIASRKRDPAWLLLSSLVVLVLLLQPLAVVLMANRYIVPTLPALAVAAAWLIVQAGNRIAARSVYPAVLMGVLVAAPGLCVAVDYGRALSLKPSRQAAREWVEANVPPGTSIIQSIPYISPVLADCGTMAQVSSPPKIACYHVRFLPALPAGGEPEFLDRSGAQYVIFTTSTPVGTLNRLGAVENVPQILRRHYRLVAQFRHPELSRFHDDTATVDAGVEIYNLRQR